MFKELFLIHPSGKDRWALVFSRKLLSVMVFAVTTVTAVTTNAAARADLGRTEALGSLELSDFFLQPAYRYVEGSRGSFGPGSSFLAVAWRHDAVISATLKFGSRDLLGLPARFNSAPDSASAQALADQFGAIEAYAQADSPWGRVRFGLVPIAYGLEGGDVEHELNFPRSLIFQTRYFALRDYGFNHHISNEGFFADWTIHNGEGDIDLDNESWFTTRLGWEKARKVTLGVSGTTGRTNAHSTNPLGTSRSNVAGLDVDRASRVRAVNVFSELWFKHGIFQLEGHVGDVIQGEQIIKTSALHADFEYKTGASVNWLFRYDLIDPRNDVGSDQITEYSLGLAWRSQYENSVFYLIGTKRAQQDVKTDEHRALVMWRITPLAQN